MSSQGKKTDVEMKQEQQRRGVVRVKHLRRRWKRVLEESDDYIKLYLERSRRKSISRPLDCLFYCNMGLVVVNFLNFCLSIKLLISLLNLNKPCWVYSLL